MEDMLDQANEVQEALGRTYGMPEMDDADLDAGSYISFLIYYIIFITYLQDCCLLRHGILFER